MQKTAGRQSLWVTFKREKSLHLMLLPAVLILFIYHMIPMFGIVIAFKKYIPTLGFVKSKWVGLKNFEMLFTTPGFFQSLRNTVIISVAKLISGIIVPVAVALLLNEVRQNAVKRTLLGVAIQMVATVLAAYPMSKRQVQFHARPFYVAYFMAAMLFSGGLIPNYLAVRYTGLINTIWALVIPNAVPVFNIILVQNFMKGLPDEISESAFIDGAGHWRTLVQIVLPLSKASLATVTLFCAVSHWNAYFDGMLYINKASNYPLQTYLRSLVVIEDYNLLANAEDITKNVTQESSQCAQIFVAIVPILCVYPFLQKHFTKGIVMGSVKG